MFLVLILYRNTLTEVPPGIAQSVILFDPDFALGLTYFISPFRQTTPMMHSDALCVRRLPPKKGGRLDECHCLKDDPVTDRSGVAIATGQKTTLVRRKRGWS